MIMGFVTKIGTHSFSRSVHLTSVAIADNVNSIEDSAFENCFSLTNVTFGNNLKNIGNQTFTSCTNLNSVTIPDGVTKIGSSAFYSCSSLTNVMIGKSVGSIGGGCFSDCRNLSAITVDAKNSVYSSVDGVLLNKRESTLVKCPQNKSGSYTIPDNITTIADDSFSFSSLTNIIVPKSVKKIVNQAFLNCKATAIYFEGNAPQIVGLPRGAESLAFADCDNLTFYYRQGTRGWQSEFAGRPAVLWK
jgi:Leucine Rich Repeat (LRR) protein